MQKCRIYITEKSNMTSIETFLINYPQACFFFQAYCKTYFTRQVKI